ncbi:GntR family transcriptional regulator [Ornithinimicrobium sp. F0845]|uniref:GntR family transcriptional regulator n=1 Tax=Ornithinimicrobium sp. F0845 TaxID=2926412 RepID=UPI001FF4B484|nr:GntR family transcriptional regulator [Ornithinimicrobium sp. F0845]
MLIRIDPRASEPIYAQIEREVRRAIASGEVTAGDRLPAARDLAASLDVNMHTVLRAYTELREAGVIDVRRGRGAVVLPQQPAAPEVGQAVADLLDAARKHGIPLSQLHQALDEGAHQ